MNGYDRFGWVDIVRFLQSDGTSVVRTKRKEVQYSEKAIVKEKAAKAGLIPSEYIRQASLNVKLTEALSVNDRESIERANSIPFKMQINLNQIAKLGHVHGKDLIAEAVLDFIRQFDAYIHEVSMSRWIWRRTRLK